MALQEHRMALLGRRIDQDSIYHRMLGKFESGNQVSLLRSSSCADDDGGDCVCVSVCESATAMSTSLWRQRCQRVVDRCQRSVDRLDEFVNALIKSLQASQQRRLTGLMTCLVPRTHRPTET